MGRDNVRRGFLASGVILLRNLSPQELLQRFLSFGETLLPLLYGSSHDLVFLHRLFVGYVAREELACMPIAKVRHDAGLVEESRRQIAGSSRNVGTFSGFPQYTGESFFLEKASTFDHLSENKSAHSETKKSYSFFRCLIRYESPCRENTCA